MQRRHLGVIEMYEKFVVRAGQEDTPTTSVAGAGIVGGVKRWSLAEVEPVWPDADSYVQLLWAILYKSSWQRACSWQMYRHKTLSYPGALD